MLRIALVGCGRIAARHSELLGNGLIEGAVLGPVCDLLPDRARAIGEKFDVPHFNDMHEMMQTLAAEIDVISVLTPSGLHAEHVIGLAEYGKHFIVEKPMALTLDDADEMIRVCDSMQVRMFVVKQNRFNLPVLKLREALESGRFGKLVLGTVRVRWSRDQAYYDRDDWRGTWAFDGGVLTNQASHHVDLLKWIMGDVDSVFAYATTALVDIEVEDTVVAVLRFRNGALGVVEATSATRPTDLEGSVSILGEGGTVEIAGFAVNEIRTWGFTDVEPGDTEVMEEYSTNPPDVYGFGHRAYLKHVVSCLDDGGPQLVDGLEARKSLELISAVYESIETGQPASLRFRPESSRLGLRT